MYELAGSLAFDDVWILASRREIGVIGGWRGHLPYRS